MVLSAQIGSRYRQELSAVHQLLLEMGGLAEECLGVATEAVAAQERAPALRVKQLEDRINQLEMDIDERCVKILALHQPAASELRFVAMAMKIVRDLERIGDLAFNTARRSVDLATYAIAVPPEFADMALAVRQMTTQALDAFVDRNCDTAQAVLVRDDVVDALYDTISEGLERQLVRGGVDVPGVLRLLHVVRDMERAADHATNIAEGVIYIVRGRDVRHGGGIA